MALRRGLVGLATLATLLSSAPRARAHCDTIDGPVVKDARTALEAGDATLALRWVGAKQEAEVREAFRRTLAVRALGPEARALADRFFFETLVRIHREGEGAPYTGLKAAGTGVNPAIAASDRALDSGAVDPLVGMIVSRAEQGLRERFARATEAKAHAGESVEKGRAFVASYVELVHYAERLLEAATGDAGHARNEAEGASTVPESHRH